MKYLIISYSSRNSLYAFAKILKQFGISSSTINTPRNIAQSCGLSLKVDFYYLTQISSLVQSSRLQGFWGVFLVTRTPTHEQIERII